MEKILSLFYLSGAILFLFCPNLAGEWYVVATDSVMRVVIKTLFPMMVLTRLISASPLLRGLEKPISESRIWKRLCLSDSLILPILCGILSGFPAVAREVERLFEKGLITKEEGEKALTLAAAPSPAFLIKLGGKTPFQGTLLFLISLALSLVTAGKMKSERSSPLTSEKTTSLPFAIADSAMTALTVSANIIFFTFLSRLFPPLTPFLELGSGSVILKETLFRAFLLGFGGVSALCQIKAEAPSLSISGVICARILTGSLFCITFFFFS